MARKVISCRLGDDIKLARDLMTENRIHRLPVVDAYGHLLGVISLTDIAREAERERLALANEAMSLEVAETVAAVSAPREARNLQLKAA